MNSDLYDIFLDHPRISTDSRRIEPDSLFFALHGANFDGNSFALAALEQGAAVAVIDNKALYEANNALGERLFLVDDTLVALQDLAREHRNALAMPIIGIVGSNGKTTTKELVSRVLAERFEVSATEGNLNNHIGVPLTILKMTAETEFGVVEMGASSCGEIALLASIAQPNYGIITNIGRSHLEGFGGIDGIRHGKGELYDFLDSVGGRAFIRAEDDVLVQMADERSSMAKEFYRTSLADGVRSNLAGDYNRYNIAVAIAVGRYFGVDEERMVAAIAEYVPSNNRSQMVKTERNRLIVDCYNANPSSMAAAIDNFLNEPLDEGQRRVALLGDMLELGEWSGEEHRAVVESLAGNEAVEVWLVGEHFTNAASGVETMRLFPLRDDLECYLAENPLSDALVLIKGSRGIGLEKVIPLL